MTTLREAAQQALEALCLPCSRWNGTQSKIVNDAIDALRAALAEPVPIIESEITADKREPVQEPLAWMDREGDLYKMPEIEGWAPPHTMLYAAPPQRKPLTDEEIRDLWSWAMTAEAERTATTQQHAFARAIERAHGIGGNGG